MKKILSFVSIIIVFTFLFGCSKNLYFGTSTSVGLDVSGTSKIPNKVSFAFNRAEVAIVPDDSNGNSHSVFASLDSEWTWFNGFIIKQTFATGEAANIASKEPTVTVTYNPDNSETSKKPLIFTTGTKLGVDIEFGQTTEAPASLLVGYRRSEMTLMPDVAGKKKLDPVFADISIYSVDNKVISASEAPQIGGVRIKQRFATGIAAVNAAGNSEVRNKLRKVVYGDPVLEAIDKAKTRFDKEGAIQTKFAKMDQDKQKTYLHTLNEILGKTSPNLITSINLQTELSKLNDTQLEVAAEQIQSF